MNRFSVFGGVVGCALALGGCATCGEPAPNTLTAEEKAEGWELLWDGKTTTGWVGAKNGCTRFPDHGWTFENGTIAVIPRNHVIDNTLERLPPELAKLGGGGDLVTERVFRDFDFKVDIRVTPGANSGVKYFYDVHKDKMPSTGLGTSPEFQFQDESLPGVAEILHPGQRTGSLYDLIPVDASRAVKPVGEWNTVRIVAKGSHVEHWLNGTKLLEYERGSADFRARVGKSKYAAWGDQPGGRWGEQPTGHILLQDHSCKVWFRNIKVRELK